MSGRSSGTIFFLEGDMRVVAFGPTQEILEFTPVARQIGQLIGTNCHALVTGGCPGPVHAVAQTAFENGCLDILAVSHARFFDLDRPDQHVCYPNIEVAETLARRIERMIEGIDLAVVFAGGPGTICELEHVFVDRVETPVVLVGADWSDLGSLTRELCQRLERRGPYRWLAAGNERYFASALIEELLRA